MATINGTINSDGLVGTTDSDVISGLAGNDTITGDGGNDTMYGGSGDDRFQIGGSGFGSDTYDGGDGFDSIYLTSDVVVSRFLLTSSNVIGTEALDFRYHSILGTGGDDVFNISGITTVYSYGQIFLQDGADQFIGYIGNDHVDGGSGNDTLRGGSGSDTLTGGGGNDSLDGGSGNDVFRIGGTDTGQDVYNGGEGADVIYLTGDVITSRLLLTSSNVIGTEVLDFRYHAILGTGGNDIFNISGIITVYGYNEIFLQDGADQFTGYIGNDHVDGGAGNDTLIGGTGSDTLTGSGGNDSLRGDSGNDVFRIGGNDIGADIYNGGEGADIIYLTGNISTARFMLTSANVIGTETLDFSYHDISGTGGADAFNLSGLQYVQNYHRIYLQDGNDQFIGYLGNDNVDGGAGNDRLSGEAGNDTLIGGTGNDTLTGGTGNDYFYIGGTDFGRDIYIGGSGDDTIYMTGDIAVSRFVLNASSLSGTERLDMSYHGLSGTGGSDYFDISGLTHVLNYSRIYLQDGNDGFTGFSGNDNVDAGAGNDVLTGGAGNDTLLGGTGVDTASYSAATGGVVVNLSLTGAQSIGGGQGIDMLGAIETIIGSNHSDRLTGDAMNNLLTGNGGNDVLDGGAGNDTLLGGLGTDTVVYTAATAGVTVNLGVSSAQNVGGGMGIDVLSAVENATGSVHGDRLIGSGGHNMLNSGSGNDAVYGGLGNDTVYGGAGHDLIYGNDGNDRLVAQSGNDILVGGAGNDSFVFEMNGGRDRLDDWQNGTDRMVIYGGTAYDSISDLSITSVSGNAVVSFGGTTITLVGVSVAQLDASDFQFV